MGGFVKSAATSVPASRSRIELERVLLRYGCDGFGSATDYKAQKVTVWFSVPDDLGEDAPTVPVKLEINIHAVYDALFGRPTCYGENGDGSWGQIFDPKGYSEKSLKQAERVAWRQLVLWVDAASSAAAAGVQKMSDAFFAHTIITDNEGRQRRLTEHLDLVTGGNWRALLAPPKE